MPLKSDRLERSLKLAENTRDLWQKDLESRNVKPELFRRDPRWRSLNAACRDIQTRMDAAKDLTERGQRQTAETSSEDSDQE